MTSINALPAAYWTGSASSTSEVSGFDSQTFLTLLTAQLKYQDPSNPADSSQFMSQTATLAQVEKMAAMVTASSENLAAGQAQAATSMIGKTVTWLDAAGTTGSGVVSSISFTKNGPSLTLSDGSTLAMSAVTGVKTTSS